MQVKHFSKSWVEAYGCRNLPARSRERERDIRTFSNLLTTTAANVHTRSIRKSERQLEGTCVERTTLQRATLQWRNTVKHGRRPMQVRHSYGHLVQRRSISGNL
jgi:hypothetical protein